MDHSPIRMILIGYKKWRQMQTKNVKSDWLIKRSNCDMNLLVWYIKNGIYEDKLVLSNDLQAQH